MIGREAKHSAMKTAHSSEATVSHLTRQHHPPIFHGHRDAAAFLAVRIAMMACSAAQRLHSWGFAAGANASSDEIIISINSCPTALLERFLDGVLGLAVLALDLSSDLFGAAFSLHSDIAGDLANSFLDRALCLANCAFDAVVIHF